MCTTYGKVHEALHRNSVDRLTDRAQNDLKSVKGVVKHQHNNNNNNVFFADFSHAEEDKIGKGKMRVGVMGTR